MKRIIFMTTLVLLLTSCSNQNVTTWDTRTSVVAESSIDSILMPLYSNLYDANTQKEIQTRLLNSKISEDKIKTLFEWISLFNNMEQDNLFNGYQPITDGVVSYNRHTKLPQIWAEECGDYEDFYCRTIGFYLTDEIISVENPISDGEQLLTQPFTYEDNGKTISAYGGDKNVIDYNPNIQWSQETQGKYYTLFNPVIIEKDYNSVQRAEAVINAWKKSEIAFADSSISLITVWNDYFLAEDSVDYVFSGHVGVLIDDNEGLLFVEKTNPLFPYQVTKFKNREQLKQYLIDTRTAENEFYGEDTGIIFVMENDILL